jgi:hypothetical protein
LLDTLAGTQGQILYRGASLWQALNPGTAGQFLQTGGAAANPTWATAGGGGLSGMTAGQIPIAATATTITSSGNLSGDVTTAGSLATSIANDAVVTAKVLNSSITYAKIQNVAANRLLGNPTGSAAAPSEIAAGQLPATATNDNAAAGRAGEYLSSNITAAASLTTATALNLTTLSLTAGDWDIEGSISFAASVATFTLLYACVSTTTLDLGQTDMTNPWARLQVTTVAGAQTTLTPVTKRLSVAGGTTVYLVAYCVFGSGSATAIGILRARRVR